MTFELTPAASGTYTQYAGDSPRKISFIVIHATQLGFDETVERFTTDHSVSAHYLIRRSDGAVTQFVNDQDIAWHAGNWAMNASSIGIELEGIIGGAEAPFTAVQMASLASLITSLTNQYGIPRDRAHIIGHDNVPAPTEEQAAKMHVDPGVQFDWSELFNQLDVPAPVVKRPQPGDLITTTKNVVPLYGGPNPDTALSPADWPEWTRQFSYGQMAVCAEIHEDWAGIWFNGGIAWLRIDSQTGALATDVEQITPEKVVTVYGGPAVDAGIIGHLPEGSSEPVPDTFEMPNLIDDNGVAKDLGPTPENQLIWFNHRLGFIH